jgi:hypothetical protein
MRVCCPAHGVNAHVRSPQRLHTKHRSETRPRMTDHGTHEEDAEACCSLELSQEQTSYTSGLTSLGQACKKACCPPHNANPHVRSPKRVHTKRRDEAGGADADAIHNDSAAWCSFEQPSGLMSFGQASESVLLCWPRHSFGTPQSLLTDGSAATSTKGVAAAGSEQWLEEEEEAARQVLVRCTCFTCLTSTKARRLTRKSDAPALPHMRGRLSARPRAAFEVFR